MFAQRKSWGPRLLAWISGVVLLVFVLVTGWTGFIMVWDQHAQAIGIAVAQIVDSTGLMPDRLSLAFSGQQAEPPSSFFFLILFIHVVVPLIMVFGIWIHTSRMARATWFPNRRIFLGLAILLLLGAIIMNASLDRKADLLNAALLYNLNIFYTWWLLSDHLFYAATGFLIFLFLLALVPIIFRPSRSTWSPKSNLDQTKCNGCVQCVIDCPYEAIKMVPRTEGSMRISEFVAEVDQSLCVSCGLCSASCARMTVGPPGRKGSDQFQQGKEIIEHFQALGEDLSNQTIIISCTNQSYTAKTIASFAKDSKQIKLYPVSCMGSLHMGTIGYLAYYFNSLILAACPERNCTNKDAFMLLRERLDGTRLPGLPGRVEASRVKLISVGEGEESKVIDALSNETSMSISSIKSAINSCFWGLILTLCVAFFSSVKHKSGDEQSGVLRLAWRMTGQVEEKCTPITDEQRKTLPLHMQKPEFCERRFLEYKLLVSLDGQRIVERVVKPGGFRNDGPLYVSEEISVPPGKSELLIKFIPIDAVGITAKNLELKQSINIFPGRVSLVHLAADQNSFKLKDN